jgi:hypothetical protein
MTGSYRGDTMRKAIALAVFMRSSVLVAQAPNVAGDWLGTLNAGVIKLRLVFTSSAPTKA